MTWLNTKKTIRIALIPAYEPDERLVSLVRQLSEDDFQVVVVDDGSSAACEKVFQKIADLAAVLRHDINRGKGAALKTGFRYLLERYPKEAAVVTVDADGQHTAADSRRLTDLAIASPGTLCLGARYLPPDAPLRSRAGNAITRTVFRLVSGANVHDTQTGLRACTLSLLPELLDIEGERYEYEMNMLLTLAKKKIPMKELPIEVIYLDGNRSSHFDPWKDSLRIYRQILKFTGSSLASFCLDYGLFMLFSLISRGWGDSSLIFSNIGARLISASANYSLNKKLVFDHKGEVGRSLVSYAALAAMILAGNTLVLKGLTMLGMGRFPAKLLTEILFFFISFIAQRRWVFRKKEPSLNVKEEMI